MSSKKSSLKELVRRLVAELEHEPLAASALAIASIVLALEHPEPIAAIDEITAHMRDVVWWHVENGADDHSQELEAAQSHAMRFLDLPRTATREQKAER